MIRFLLKVENPEGSRTFYETMPLQTASHCFDWITYRARNDNPANKVVAFHPVTHPFTVRIALEHIEQARESLDQMGMKDGRDYLSAQFTGEDVFWFATVSEAAPIKMFYAKAHGWSV